MLSLGRASIISLFMRIFTFGLLILLFNAGFAQTTVTDKRSGDWLLINGLVVLQITDEGTMTLRNTGAKGRLTRLPQLGRSILASR